MSTISISYRNWRAKTRNEPRTGPKSVWGARIYDSKLNADIAEDLDNRVSMGEILSWRSEVRLELRVNDVLVCNYKIDFECKMPDGSVQLIEGKGEIVNGQLPRFKWNLLQAIKDELYPQGVEMIKIKG